MVHRALADERRSRIVEELRQEPAGLDAQALARRLDLHSNTIRWHLGILADAGIVASRPADRTTPGRPRIVYTLKEDADVGEPEHYRLLATMLSGAIGGVDDGLARAREAGREWGRYLVKSPPPHARPDRTEATGEIMKLLDEHGFKPEVGDCEIRMRRCPFRELAEADDGGVVCAVHLGLISGALAELRSDLDVERLDAFVEPGLCIATLSAREPEPD
jgi:predicted ArsR family transcriptional regulator